MRKFTLLAGTAALIALSGCAYNDDYYGRGGYYDGGGYYGDYYGPGYYDPYYNGANDWYYDGSYYFYYDRHSHRWNRRDHGPDRGHRDGNDHGGSHNPPGSTPSHVQGDRNWGRNHDWRSDRNAPWNRSGADRAQPQVQPDRSQYHRDYNSGSRDTNSRGQVNAPRSLAPPPPSPKPPADNSDDDQGPGRERDHR